MRSITQQNKVNMLIEAQFSEGKKVKLNECFGHMLLYVQHWFKLYNDISLKRTPGLNFISNSNSIQLPYTFPGTQSENTPKLWHHWIGKI